MFASSPPMRPRRCLTFLLLQMMRPQRCLALAARFAGRPLCQSSTDHWADVADTDSGGGRTPELVKVANVDGKLARAA